MRKSPGPLDVVKLDLTYPVPSKPTLSALYALLPQHLLYTLSGASLDVLNSSRKRLAGNMSHLEWEQVKTAARAAYELKKASWSQTFSQRGYTLTDAAFETELAKIGKYHAAASSYNSALL